MNELISSKLKLGNDFIKQNKIEEAKNIFQEIIEIDPKIHQAYKFLSIIEFQKKNFIESLKYLDKSLKFNKNSSDLYSIKGLILIKLNKKDEALKAFSESIKYDPKNINSLLNLGVIFKENLNFIKSLESFNQIIKFDDKHYVAYTYKAYVQIELNKFSESIISLNKAISIKEDYFNAYLVRGNSFMALNEFKKSLKDYDFIINNKSSCEEKIYFEALFNKGLLLLMNEKYYDGWEHYEYRFRAKNITKPLYLKDIPFLKNLSDLKKKSLLIHAEQGIGDNIQFIRYIFLIKKYCPDISFLVNKKLCKILEESELGIKIISSINENTNYDFHCPIMSLPYKLSNYINQIPYADSYINIKEERILKWRKIFSKQKFNIGINWTASLNSQLDKGRSIPLENFRNISLLNDVNLFSLQKNPGDNVKLLKQMNIHNFEKLDENHTFIDTAPIIKNLDLIITCDTSIAHLAGSLGKKTFLILQKNSEWRWLREKNVTPWYKSIKIFRQRIQDEWKEPFKEIELEIKNSFSRK